MQPTGEVKWGVDGPALSTLLSNFSKQNVGRVTTVVFNHRSWFCSHCISGAAVGVFPTSSQISSCRSVTETGVRCFPLKSQYRSQVNGQESLLNFRCQQLGIGGEGGTRVQRPNPPTDNQGARAFRPEGGVFMQKSTVSSNSHLETGHRWSDQASLWLF